VLDRPFDSEGGPDYNEVGGFKKARFMHELHEFRSLRVGI
jgi:hypothetical protein